VAAAPVHRSLGDFLKFAIEAGAERLFDLPWPKGGEVYLRFGGPAIS
jgi:hypothetical protein